MIEIPHVHELVSFVVELQYIVFCFGPIVVRMSDEIEIIAADGSIQRVESVWNRTGDLNALWPLIGKRLAKLEADEDAFRLIFEDGTMIRRRYEARNELVTFTGPDSDDFTRYPDDLEPPTPEQLAAAKEAVRNMLGWDPFDPNRRK